MFCVALLGGLLIEKGGELHQDMQHGNFKVHEWKSTGSQHTHDTHQNPKDIQQGLGVIFFKNGTPGKDYCIGRVKSPDKKERTFCTQPTHQGETENPHEYTYRFDGLDVFNN